MKTRLHSNRPADAGPIADCRLQEGKSVRSICNPQSAICNSPNPQSAIRNPQSAGYAMAMVLVFLGLTMFVLSGAMNWSASIAFQTERNNTYFAAAAAAEAATESVLARISYDYQNSGEPCVYAALDSYRTNVPSPSQNSYWATFEFKDGAGVTNRMLVERLSPTNFVPLSSQYSGLNGLASTYRVISNARDAVGRQNVQAAVGQDLQIASIPIYQFAVFYNIDMEVNPGANMTVKGRVHGNANIYLDTGATLTFANDVTAASEIVLDKKPGDPLTRSPGTVIFQKEHDSGVASMTLPIGTNNSPDAVHALIEIPPLLESPTSLMGKQRFYNKADLVLIVTDTTVTATSGALVDGMATSIGVQWTYFMSTNVTFYNKREGKTILCSEIDVAKLIIWSATNTLLRPVIGNRDVAQIYLADMRTHSSGSKSSVRLVNAQTLPSLGLSLATPNPAYIQGHFNCPTSAHLGTTNTSSAKGAALAADAITILSSGWNDANSSAALSARSAANTTVNCAFLVGIVPTGGGYYSGGVENLTRFLENWSGDTFTYNGSMVVLFDSRHAVAPWGGGDVYSPPVRNWSFDLNYMDAAKLPPGTPQIQAMIRARWALVRPGSTSF